MGSLTSLRTSYTVSLMYRFHLQEFVHASRAKGAVEGISQVLKRTHGRCHFHVQRFCSYSGVCSSSLGASAGLWVLCLAAGIRRWPWGLGPISLGLPQSFHGCFFSCLPGAGQNFSRFPDFPMEYVHTCQDDIPWALVGDLHVIQTPGEPLLNKSRLSGVRKTSHPRPARSQFEWCAQAS